MPTLIKDLLAPAQGDVAYEGNRRLKEIRNVANSDSCVVTKMKQAGLVSIGRTNVPEFATGMCPASCETVAFGATKNPWDPTRTAMGSSGGAANPGPDCRSERCDDQRRYDLWHGFV